MDKNIIIGLILLWLSLDLFIISFFMSCNILNNEEE